MSKPRVFISSTYYDLKHLRSSMENFVESLGFESVLSEKGDIAYTPDTPLDESCYREAGSADIFVLIIGGRYGSQASSKEKKSTKNFYERYDSITKQEYCNALSRDIPVYVLIESNVFSEYHTFLKNKENKKIEYAHVDSVNIFRLIEDILSQPKNNPIQTFERYAEIEDWLKEQWAGLFKELLIRMTNQQQIATLSSKVSELGEINVTLKNYLETLIKNLSPDSGNIIESEDKRLDEAKTTVELKKNQWVQYVTRRGFSFESCITAIKEAKTLNDFVEILSSICKVKSKEERYRIQMFLNDFKEAHQAREDFNQARRMLGLPPLELSNSCNCSIDE